MTCPFAHDDAAYVLGALAPDERLAFERHLPGCPECSHALSELAGLPGLLGRVSADVLARTPDDEPLPASQLPALTRAVRRHARRRSLVSAGLAVAAAALVAALSPVVAGRLGHDAAPSRAASSSTVTADVVSRPMVPVGEVPVRASVGLQPVTWGTRLLVTCTYEPASVGYDLPPAADYTLFVRTRAGRTEQVGSWRSVTGAPMHVTAATSARPADIAAVEVRTLDGRVVLRLAA